MGHVIPLHGDPHEATQRLLPWYVTGTLDPTERALVEQHLADCEECRAELESEQRLRATLAALPPVPAGQWETLRDRAMAPAAAWPAGQAKAARSMPRWLALAAGQAAILVAGVGAYEMLRPKEEAAYHGLSANRPAADPRGNLIVMFRPDLPEAAMRGALNAVGARLVDGPTAGGAYVLAVPAGRQAAALKVLQARSDVMLAQPIDAGGPQ